MVDFRTILVFVGIILIISPITAERVFFSDGTTYNASLSKDEVIRQFYEYSESGPIVIFHDQICTSCLDAMDYLKEFEKNYPDIDIVYYDLHGNTTNKLIFEEYMQTYHQKNLLAPTAFIGPVGVEGNESIKMVFEPFSLLYMGENP